jgi:hypothetical protein
MLFRLSSHSILLLYRIRVHALANPKSISVGNFSDLGRCQAYSMLASMLAVECGPNPKSGGASKAMIEQSAAASDKFVKDAAKMA